MSTLEKLLVQIFDRKNSIIEQVKRQTELYNQHLASKLLIHGITPPSWLCKPNSSSDANEVNKEELISKILCPQYPLSSACGSSTLYPVYMNPLVAGYKEELSDRTVVDNAPFDGGHNMQDGLSVPTMCSEHRAGCTVYAVPEITITSPEDRTDERMAYMLNAADQSIAGGSKVRQQALELRKSAKTISKSSLCYEKSNVRASSEMRFSLSAENHADKEGEMQSVEPVTPDRGLTVQYGLSIPTISNKHHAGSARDAVSQTDISVMCPEDQSDDRIVNSLNSADQSIAGLQRSKSRQKALELRNSAKTVSKSSSSHEKSKDRISSEIGFSISAAKQLGQENELQRVDEVCVSTGNILKNSGLGAANLQSQEKEKDTYCSKISWSMSQQKVPDIIRVSPRQSHYSDTCKVDVSSDFATLRRKDSTNNSDPEKVVEGGKLDGENGLIKEGEMDSARCAISKTGAKHKNRSADSSKANCSDNHQMMKTLIMDFGNDLVLNFVDRSEGNNFRIDSEAQESMASYDRSCQENNLQKASAYLDTPSEPSLTDNDIVAAQSEISELHVHDSDMDPALVRSSLGLDHRVTRPYTRSYPNDASAPLISNKRTSLDDTMFKPDDSPKAGENEDLQNAASSEFSNSCHGIRDSLDEHGNLGSVSANEHDQCGRPCSNGSMQKNELEIQVARNPSDSFLFHGLQHLHFDKNGKLEFKNINSNLGEISLDDSSEKTCPDTSGGFTDQESQACQCGEGNDKFSLDSNTRDNKDFRSMHDSRLESRGSFIEKFETRISSGGVIDEIKRLSPQNLKMSSCPVGKVHDQIAEPTMDGKDVVSGNTSTGLHGDNSSLERISRHARLELQPPLKVRKLEHRKGQSISPAPSFWVEKPHNPQRNASTSLGSIGNALIDACDTNNGVDTEFLPEMITSMTESVGCTFSFRDREVDDGLYDDETENIQTRVVSSFTEEKSSSSCFIERSGTSSSCKSDNETNTSDEQKLENLTLTNWMIGVQSLKSEDAPKTHDSVLSSQSEELEFTDIDESMPVFEGFSVGSETGSCMLDQIAGGIDFDKLNSSRSTIERASILAELCKSACLDTPLAHFSSAVEFQETQNVYASTGNVQLDQSEFRNPVPAIDADEQLPPPTTLTDDLSNSIKRMTYCDFQPYSGSQYGLDLGSRHPSPVGKLRASLSSYSGSSGKRLGSSSNSDLMCFPIEEYPTTNEDNDAVGNADDIHRDTDPSMVKNCENRQPLQDLTNLCSNPLQPVSDEEKAYGVDKVYRTKPSVTGSQDEAQDNPRHGNRNKSVTREKQTSSIAANGGRNNLALSVGTNQIKIKESATSSLSQRNNIFSNVSSFIPLVQQKQAAAAGPGKRDVKVKALEAAEAAKRFEEKKQKERKMRKEALKLERAKLEERKLKLMELEKRSREERKKKDADKIARKRMREEDERKEKEKKKLRIEQRRLPREPDEKARSEKAEEGKQQLKDYKTNKKGVDIVSEKQQKLETRDDLAVRKTETKLIPAEVVKAGEVVERSPQTENMLPHKSTERSYDISPYQCSDNDDEDDDDDLPTKKHVPSWASKSSVALHLPLQLEMDSDMIFPQESFCSIEEVIQPRKLQSKIRC